jgi:hypothetical protein
MSEQRRVKQLEALYAELPAIPCQRKCHESCGPILMTKLEWTRIERVATGNFREIEPDLNCPLLRNNECSVYETRPLICRLWGLVERMRCPFGCVPERWLTDAEAYSLLDRVGKIGR